MITKLKWLKAYFTRDILPATGATIGKVLYTAKNTTGRRTQYVIDLDADNMDVTTIDADPADPTTLPGSIVVTNNTFAPQNDKNLYGFGISAITPVVLRVTTPATFDQSIVNAGTITATNILTGVTFTNFAGTTAAATTTNCTLTSVAASGLVLNTGTGAVTLTSATVAGTFTLDYKIADKNEPAIYITGTVTVVVALPIMAKVVQAEFSQQIANGASIASVNVLTGVTVNGGAATTGNSTITSVSADGLTLNTGTGAVTLDDNLTAGTYTVNYKVANTLNATVFITGTITVIVDPA